MSKNNLYPFILSALLLLFNVLLLYLLTNERKRYGYDLYEKETTILNLNHRIVESTRVASYMTGRTIIPFSGAVTGAGEIIDTDSIDRFRSSYLLVISGNTCPTCIPEAFSIISDLAGSYDPEGLFFIGEFSSPAVMFQTMGRKGLSIEQGIHSPVLARYLAGREEIPVLLKIGEDLKIDGVCLVDKHMPLDYYRNFFSK